MKDLESILNACEIIGPAIYEQNQKLYQGKIVIQERIKIDLPSIVDELLIHQMSNLCKSYSLKCQIISLRSNPNYGFVRDCLQLQLYEKEN